MRTTFVLAGLCSSILFVGVFVACSSSTSAPSGGDDTTSDSGPSTSSSGGTDAGNPGPGNDAGPGTDAGSDAGGFACTSPAGCTLPATPICCGVINVTGGTIPNCTTDPPVVSCKASAQCATDLGTGCSGTQTIRLCASNNDCTEPTYNKCCTFGDDAGALSFCANTITATFGGGTCM